MTAASFILLSLIFLSGIVLVIWSVDKFVDRLAPAAVGIGVSVFLLTIVLAGTDIENAVLGVAAAVGGLPDVAIGTVFGEALFILGAAVGLAGVISPFELQTPRRYLLLTARIPDFTAAYGRRWRSITSRRAYSHRDISPHAVAALSLGVHGADPLYQIR